MLSCCEHKFVFQWLCPLNLLHSVVLYKLTILNILIIINSDYVSVGVVGVVGVTLGGFILY